MRYALRRTQKQVDQSKKETNKYFDVEYSDMEYRDLQAEAVARGINGRQSRAALIKELSSND